MKTRLAHYLGGNLFCTLLLVVLGAGLMRPLSAEAGITLEIRAYRYSENGYIFYTPLNTNAIAPAAPLGTYLIYSPQQPTNGSWRQLELSANGFETVAGSETVATNFVALMDQITNGLWTVVVTNSAVTNTYQFRVNGGTITSNTIPLVNITAPLNNATLVPNQPLFTWTGPTSWAGTVDVFDLWRLNENSNYDFVTGASLPANQFSWTSPVALPDGENYFNVTYRTNSTAFFSATVPTNAAAATLSGWSVASFMESFSSVTFNVGQPLSGFDAFLVGRYNFENPNAAGNDSSGQGNNNNCTGTSGNNPVVDVASTDAAVGAFARQFYGESSICFTDGGTAFPNLSNALSGNFTVTAWVKTTSSIGSDTDDALWGMPILSSDDAGGDHTHPISITGSRAAFSVYDENNDATTIHSSTAVNDGTYHFIAVTRQRSTGLMELYVDGQLQDSATGPTSVLVAATYFDIASGNNNYTGLLDDLRIYSTNLAAGDIATIFGNVPASPLAEAVDAPALPWTTGGDASWFNQTANTHDGVDAAQSGSIGDDESSWIETTIAGPGTISFWWRVSSEQDQDYLEFLVDGNFEDALTGDSDWVLTSYEIPSGSHTLRWNYYKDGFGSDYLDAAFLDEVSFVPTLPPTITFQPIDQTNSPGYLVTLVADANSVPEADWQWYKLGTGALPNGSARFLTLTNSGTVAVAGSYYAIASNAAGSVNTRTAIVTFVSAPVLADWTKAFQTQIYGNFDNPRTNYGIATLVDASGNVYSASSFSGTNYFNSSNTFIAAPGRFASGLFKHTPAGAGVWARAITNTGNGNSYPQCLAKAPGDGVYMSGVFHGTNQLGTNVLQSPLDVAWLYLARFDAAGNVLWVRTFGGTNSQFQTYHQLVADADGNVTISALGDKFVNFGTTNVVLPGQRGILAQYDANGTLRWISQPSGWVSYMAAAAGRIYTVQTWTETNFIGGLTNNSDRKYLLASLNGTNGQALWLQGIGSSSTNGNPAGAADDVPALAVSGADLFVVGKAWGNGASFGAVNLAWSTAVSQYFARFNTNGTPQLATAFGGTNTWPWAAVADATGNVYVTGDFDGYAAFGDKIIGGPRLGGIAEAFRGQMFVAKFDRNGNSLWVKQAQSEVPTSFVNVRDLALTVDGVWTCGFVNYYANFGTNLGNRVYGADTIVGFPFGFLYYYVNGYLAKVTEASVAVANPITLLNPASSGGIFEFQFPTQNGFTHTVQYRTNLVTGQGWQTYSNVTGNGSVKIIGVPQSLFAPAQQGFLRVSTQ